MPVNSLVSGRSFPPRRSSATEDPSSVFPAWRSAGRLRKVMGGFLDPGGIRRTCVTPGSNPNTRSGTLVRIFWPVTSQNYFLWPFLFLIPLMIGDVVTTTFALKRGYSEVNPFVAVLAGDPLFTGPEDHTPGPPPFPLHLPLFSGNPGWAAGSGLQRDTRPVPETDHLYGSSLRLYHLCRDLHQQFTHASLIMCRMTNRQD